MQFRYGPLVRTMVPVESMVDGCGCQRMVNRTVSDVSGGIQVTSSMCSRHSADRGDRQRVWKTLNMSSNNNNNNNNSSNNSNNNNNKTTGNCVLNQQVLAFSFYGDPNSKVGQRRRYFQGIRDNLELIPQFYPGKINEYFYLN